MGQVRAHELSLFSWGKNKARKRGRGGGSEMIMSHDETNFIPTKIEDIPRATQNFKILKGEKRTTEVIC